jgi:mannose-1-phosphate guanylyltransferase
VKAMVLAAGKGTRLSTPTEELPKPMALIVNKPIIQHIFELLARTGVEEIHVILLAVIGRKTGMLTLRLELT